MKISFYEQFKNTVEVEYCTGRKETWGVNNEFLGLFVEDKLCPQGYRELRDGWDCYSPNPKALVDNITNVTFTRARLVKGSVRGFVSKN